MSLAETYCKISGRRVEDMGGMVVSDNLSSPSSPSSPSSTSSPEKLNAALTLAAAEKAKLSNTMAEAEVVLETVNRSLNSTLGEDDREDSEIADEMGESNIAVYEVGGANEIDEDFVVEQDGGAKEKKDGGARAQVEDVLEEASHGMSDENNAAAGVVVVDGVLPPASTFALIEDDCPAGRDSAVPGSSSMVKAEAKSTVQDLKSSTAVDAYAKEIEIAGGKDLQYDAKGSIASDRAHVIAEKPAASSIDASGIHGQHTAEKRRKPQVVFVLGGPGVGKGTQCANIVKKYGWCHLSAGDLLRAERANASAEADLINSCIKEGKLVPVEITVKLLLAAMQQSKTQSFLLDGFPRSIDNYEGWCAAVGDQADVACCLFYECGQGELERRLLDRGKTSGRDDDNIQSIKKRFITFMNETSPIVEVCVCVFVCARARGRVRVCCGMSWHALMEVKREHARTHACARALSYVLSLSHTCSFFPPDLRESRKAANYQR